jgi:hypothetical protein
VTSVLLDEHRHLLDASPLDALLLMPHVDDDRADERLGPR